MYPPVVLRRVLLRPAQPVSEYVASWHGVLKLVPQSNSGSVFQIPPQPHHLLPVCCCLCCHVTCQFFCAVHDVSSVDDKKFQLLPMLYSEWFRQGSKSVRSTVVPSCPNFPTFSSPQSHLFCLAPILALLGHGDLQRCQIGCSCFADDCFCMFLVCLVGYPNSVVPAELSIQNYSPPSTSLVRPQVL